MKDSMHKNLHRNPSATPGAKHNLNAHPFLSGVLDRKRRMARIIREMEAHVAMVWKGKHWLHGSHDGMSEPIAASLRTVTA